MEFKRLTQDNNFKNFLTGMVGVLIVLVIILIIKRSLPKDVLAMLILVMAYYTYKEYRKDKILNSTKYRLENDVLTISVNEKNKTVSLSDIDYIVENNIRVMELKTGLTKQNKYWIVLKDKKKIEIYNEMKNNRNKSIIEFLNRNCSINMKSVQKFSPEFVWEMLLGLAAVVLIVLLRR